MEKILVLDFGSQYTQLIARRIRELNIYSEIIPYHQEFELTDEIKGVILSGSPASVNEEQAPLIDLNRIIGQKPLLGICFGAQHLAHSFGGTVARSNHREYGKAELSKAEQDNALFKAVEVGSTVWMSHGDTIENLPENCSIIASSNNIAVAGFKMDTESAKHPVYGIQFHPEVTHTECGAQIIRNFCQDICACKMNWTPDHFVESTVQHLQAKLGEDKVIMGLSGGVDSSVAATLLHKAIDKNLYCIFVDNGLLRKEEFEEVLESYKNQGLNIIGVDAKEEFYASLAGLRDPELKRKAIGKTFIDVFERESKKIEGAKWLGQGTIYPDIIESVSVHGPSVTIKSHHNVGGLPEKMDLQVVEPLAALFKDEVRKIGKSMGLPHHLIGRHPFPGPGLGIRILSDITPEKVKVLQEADAIFINILREEDLYDKIWQAGAILTPIQTVGVMGDERTYENVVALRAVTSVDGMTADWYNIPYDILGKISTQIINKVKGVNRVVYDISTKPPATIEWE